MEYKGHHVTLDMKFTVMPTIDTLEAAIENAIARANMHVVKHIGVPFSPQGDTCVWILSESHFTLHTYPESCYASMDCYTCGEEGDPQAAMRYLVEFFNPVRSHIQEFKRGLV